MIQQGTDEQGREGHGTAERGAAMQGKDLIKDARINTIRESNKRCQIPEVDYLLSELDRMKAEYEHDANLLLDKMDQHQKDLDRRDQALSIAKDALVKYANAFYEIGDGFPHQSLLEFHKNDRGDLAREALARIEGG